MTINERIQALRAEMQRESLAAYIFTSTDPKRNGLSYHSLLSTYKYDLGELSSQGVYLIHVADAAVAIANALTRGTSGQRYLLTGQNLSLKQFYRVQARTCNYRQCLLLLPDWLLAAAGRCGQPEEVEDCAGA